MIDVPTFDLVPADVWSWPDFSPREMACRADGRLVVDTAFMDRLQALRSRLGFPMPVSSGYRSPAYNALVSTTGSDGPHTTGEAADILVFGTRAFTLIECAPDMGFSGLGISQNGPRGKRFVHLDTLGDGPGCPRPWIWSY